MFKGFFLLIAGIAIIIGGIVVGISWLGICFGSVVLGVVLLIFAPSILLFPFVFSFTTGGAMVKVGMDHLKGLR